jgi:hypothetical protein
MTKQITIKVDIVGGAGGVFIDLGIGEDKIRHIVSSTEYAVALEPGHYIAVCAGSEPTNGSLSIQVLDGNTILKSVTFTQPAFVGFLIFDVK